MKKINLFLIILIFSKILNAQTELSNEILLNGRKLIFPSTITKSNGLGAKIYDLTSQNFPSIINANNGLNFSSSAVKLGGNLLQNTNIDLNSFNLSFNGSLFNNGFLQNGYFGIGTTSPISDLHLANISSNTPRLLQFTHTSVGNTINDGSTIGLNTNGNFQIINKEATSLELYTSNILRWFIPSSGEFRGSLQGTSLLPSITIGNDNNTGWFQPSADMIGLSTNGTERLRIDNLGNVGINNITPTSTLSVNGSQASTVTNITATTILNSTHNKILVSNGATNITITLPDALTCLGREYVISRAAGSTGSITIQRTGTNTIQALNGTLGATTSISLHSATGAGLNVRFTAINIGGIGVWVRL